MPTVRTVFFVSLMGLFLLPLSPAQAGQEAYCSLRGVVMNSTTSSMTLLTETVVDKPAAQEADEAVDCTIKQIEAALTQPAKNTQVAKAADGVTWQRWEVTVRTCQSIELPTEVPALGALRIASPFCLQTFRLMGQ